MSTLGVNITRKVVNLPDQVQTRLLIWDLSGNEKFDGARADYIRGSSGALLVCDLTREDTIDRLSYFKDYLCTYNTGIPIILIGNKSDLVETTCQSIQHIKKIASEHQILYEITSAKTGNHVEAAFVTLARLMVAKNE